jgi:hypothetical protein
MFHVSAYSGMFETIKPIEPTSYKGSVDVAQVLYGLAQQMGLGFENSGVTGAIANPYWPGSLGQQLTAVCKAAGCDYLIDKVANVLAVWPKGGARNGQDVLLSKDTGMIGYPSFTQNGVQVRSLFNPSLAFGRTIKIESQFTPAANGRWTIAAISHNLDANVPNGQWQTEVECSLFGQEVAIIG